ncbi:hypothetical protein [Lentzea sp. NBRC 102530]|nr:hypothetical protein [Lentzea sp. NBRC 102530]
MTFPRPGSAHLTRQPQDGHRALETRAAARESESVVLAARQLKTVEHTA